MISQTKINKPLPLAIFFVCIALSLAGQEQVMSIKSIETDIHTIGGRSELFVDIIFDLEEGISIDLAGFPYSEQVLISSGLHGHLTNRLELISALSWQNKGFRCKFNLNDNGLIEKLTHSAESFFLKSESDLIFQTSAGPVLISSNELKERSTGKLQITFEQQQELLSSLSRNQFLYNNYFHFGFDPVTEKLALSLDYRYSRTWGQNQYGLYFFSEGRLSTNPSDVLNYFKLSPVNMNIWTDALARHTIVVRSGLEADQIFSTARINIEANIESIIPNLIDLSYGYNRLRLKPVITAGAVYYHEIKSPADKEQRSAFLLTSEIYYYIPVMESYFLLLKGKAFYDTGQTVNDPLNYLASIVVGLDLKFTPATMMAKFVFGYNQITFERDDQLLIGFAIDMFSGR